MSRCLRVQAVREYFISVDSTSEKLFALEELLEAAAGKKLKYMPGLAGIVGMIAADLMVDAEMGMASLDSLELL